MEQYISKSALLAWIKRRMDENSGKQTLPQYFGMVEEDLNILSFIDTLEVKYLQEEPVSEELESAALMHFKDVMEYEIKTGLKMANITSFKAGAKWQLRKSR